MKTKTSTTASKKTAAATGKTREGKTAPKAARPTKASKPAKPAAKPAPAAAKPAAKPAKPAAAESTKLSAKEKNDLKDLLLALRDRLTGHVAVLKDASLKRYDAVVSPEDGTDIFERQFALMLASTENDAVFEIDEALRRLEQGAYGTCEECGTVIGLHRLKALPFVRTCIGCQSEREKGRLRFKPIE